MLSLWILALGGCFSEGPCPDGATQEGAAPPDGLELKCVGDGGVSHGPFTRWHGPGQVAAQGRYVHGRPDGTFEERNPAGVLISEATYRDGEYDGLVRTWDDDGRLEESAHYVKGVLDGEFTRFEDGVRIVWGTYAAGERVGEWGERLGDPEGWSIRRTYEGGAPVGAFAILDEQGRQRPLRSRGPADGPVSVGGKDEDPVYTGQLEDGRRSGEWTTWYAPEAPAARFTWRDGVRDGPFEILDRDGAVLRKGTYAAGVETVTEGAEPNPIRAAREIVAELEGGAIAFAPAVRNDRWVLVLEDGTVRSERMATKKQEWEARLPGPATGPPRIAYVAGKWTVLVPTGAGVSLFDLGNGEGRPMPEPPVELEPAAQGRPELGAAWPTGMECLGTDAGRFLLDGTKWYLACAGGTTVWRVDRYRVENPAPKPVWSIGYGVSELHDVEALDGMLLLRFAHEVRALDLLTGRRVWSVGVSSPRIVRRDGALVMLGERIVLGVHAVTGEELWRHSGPSGRTLVIGDVAVREESPLMGAGPARPKGLDLETGMVRWKLDRELANGNWGECDGAAVLRDRSGMFAVDAERGTLRFEVPAPEGAQAAFAEPGRVVFVDGDAYRALNCDGRPAWPERRVEGYPSAPEMLANGSTLRLQWDHTEDEGSSDLYLDVRTGSEVERPPEPEVAGRRELYGKAQWTPYRDAVYALTYATGRSLSLYDHRFDPDFESPPR